MTYCIGQFVELNGLLNEFESLEVGVAGMTYDNASVMAVSLASGQLVSLCCAISMASTLTPNWNEDYGPDTFGYGIPYPPCLISADGVILAWSFADTKIEQIEGSAEELVVAISAKARRASCWLQR